MHEQTPMLVNRDVSDIDSVSIIIHLQQEPFM